MALGCVLAQWLGLRCYITAEEDKSFDAALIRVLLWNAKFLLASYLLAFSPGGTLLLPLLFGAEGALLGALFGAVLSAQGAAMLPCLSFSTKGSAKDDEVTKVQNAVAKAKEVMTVPVDGEMQFDAAVAPEVGQLKFPGSPVAGQANTFIFPDVTAGNIGYKIAARLGGFAAYGPILLGLNAPINDLSRGCNADEVYKMAIITAGLA